MEPENIKLYDRREDISDSEESSEEEKEGHSDSEESQSSSRSFEAIEKIYGANSAQPKSTNY